MTFNDLKLSAPLLKAVSEAGYETPSPFQHRRNGRCLNGRGGFIARLCHSTQHRRGKIQFVKCHSSPKMFLHSI